MHGIRDYCPSSFSGHRTRQSDRVLIREQKDKAISDGSTLNKVTEKRLCMSESNLYEELNPIFKPRSVAILGASAKEGKVGKMFMDRFVETGFEKLYPINPGADEVQGFKAYPSVKDVPDEVDFALIVLPPKAVLQAVRECVEKGVAGVVINSAGFSEEGEEGKKIEQEIANIARDSNTRLIGPNCIGIYCPSSKLPYPMRPGKESGKVGVVSQSGSLADHLTLIATNNGINFSKSVSCGNQCDLIAEDFIEYLGDDPETEIIVVYLEGAKDGQRLSQLLKNISRKKPIILWKTGTSEAGARAAASHTGSLAGSAEVWEGVLKGAGVVSVKSLEEILDTVYTFDKQPLPNGNKVAIITGPGGPAVGTTDTCIEMGLQVPRLSDETKEKLKRAMPPVGTSVVNPIDLSLASIVTPDVYTDVVKILGEDDNIDMIMVIGIGGEEFHRVMLNAVDGLKKPLVSAIIMPLEVLVEDYNALMQGGIPVFPDPRRAAKSLARLSTYAEHVRNSHI